MPTVIRRMMQEMHRQDKIERCTRSNSSGIRHPVRQIAADERAETLEIGPKDSGKQRAHIRGERWASLLRKQEIENHVLPSYITPVGAAGGLNQPIQPFGGIEHQSPDEVKPYAPGLIDARELTTTVVRDAHEIQDVEI